MKRLLDVVLSAALLAVLSPVLAVIGVFVRVTSPGPALYRSRRVGRDGAEFTMYKFRTMRGGEPTAGSRITARNDARVTGLGRFLRSARLDELPQLWNVLRGEMSLVGPRPEDPRFVRLYTPQQRAVLSVRPGIAGPAQLVYRDEARLLPASDPEAAYSRDIMPRKLEIDLDYVRHRSLRGDALILLRTLAAAVRR